MYNPDNPDYKDWIEEFYVPLMQHACRCVKPGKFVCIHIGDTSAGQIVPFLKNRVHQITSLKLVYNLGLMGVMSEKIRDVWVFQKALVPSPSRGVVSAAAAARHSLNVERIRAATNPPLHVAAVRDPRNGREYRVIDDGHVCVGGTKQRLLGRIIRHIPAEELVYAGPGLYPPSPINKRTNKQTNKQTNYAKPHLIKSLCVRRRRHRTGCASVRCAAVGAARDHLPEHLHR